MLEQVVERIRRVDPGDSPFFGNTGHSLEWQTRYYMVDPLLQALGWDTSCPQEVRVEWRVPGGGRVDYALFAPGDSDDPKHLYVPRVLIEVKRKQVNLPVAVSDQLSGYVHHWPEMVGWAAMTNGISWHFYHAEGGTIPPRTPAEIVDLSLGSAIEASTKIGSCLGRHIWLG